MYEQSRKIRHVKSSVFMNEPQADLADFIVDYFAHQEMQKVDFVSTGTEATELSIKLARIHHLNSGTSRTVQDYQQMERLSSELTCRAFFFGTFQSAPPV